jgi:hypothetical protein
LVAFYIHLRGTAHLESGADTLASSRRVHKGRAHFLKTTHDDLIIVDFTTEKTLIENIQRP